MCFKHLPEDLDTVGFFFLRNSVDPVPIPSSFDTAHQTLPLVFETGITKPNPLHVLENILKHLYAPLLMESGQQSGERALEGDEEDRKRMSRGGTRVHLRDEVLINVQKFTSQVSQTIQQVEGQEKLVIPPVDMTVSAQILAKDNVIVSQLETSLDTWSRIISDTIEDLRMKDAYGKGPLAELDSWKDKYAALNALYLQLQSDAVAHILAILKEAGSSSPSVFEVSKADLSKAFVEAKDNVRFLGTLERNFKTIAHGASFKVVGDTLPTMMNGLKMVWVISRHYNTDERMVPLMERIAWELCERVARVIRINSIFK